MMRIAGFVIVAACLVWSTVASAQVQSEVRPPTVRDVARTAEVRPTTGEELREALGASQRARFERRGNALVARLLASGATDRELTPGERREVERYIADLASVTGRDADEVRDAAWELAATQLERQQRLLAANDQALQSARHLVRMAIAELRQAQRARREATYIRPTLGRDGQRLLLQQARVTTSAEDGVDAMRELQSMNDSFHMQYLDLQNAMQRKNREFTMLSNIMKTKHDTTRSLIQNIR